MPDLFGAPLGIIASQDMNRQNMLAGLKAQEMMGAIAQQPAELALKQAHAKLYGAEGDLAEAKVAELKRSADLYTRMTGLPLTADAVDITTGAVKAFDPAQQMFDYAQKMQAAGGRATDVMPYLKAGVDFATKASQAAHTTAQAAEQEALAKKEQRKRLGATASALLSSPATFNQMMLTGQVDPELEGLPRDYNAAKPVLEFISQRAIEADKKEELRLSELRAKAAQASSAAAQGVATARIGVLQKRGVMLQQDIDMSTKTGGKYSPEMLEAKRAQANNAASLTAARDAKMFPGIPVDPKGAEVGKNYTLPDGRRVTLVGKTPDGKYQLQPITTSAGPVRSAAPATEEEDFND